MRILIIVLVFCLVTCNKLRNQSLQKLQTELQKSNYGRALLHLVQLHSMTEGAVSELVDVIEELINDLEEGLEYLDFNFQRRTNEHNALFIQFNQQIQQAQIDICY